MRLRDFTLELGALAGALTMAALLAVLEAIGSRARSFSPGMALSPAQMTAVARAIRDHEAAAGARPMKLAELVAAGRLTASDLFDRGRQGGPRMAADTGEFTESPDVLYFPAVRSDDPPDLVLLCTLFSKRRGGTLPAVRNDYRLVQLTQRQMVAALNRTCAHVGSQIARPAGGGGYSRRR